MNQILSVSQINGYLKGLLDEDVQLKSIYIRGEISNFTNHLRTGHFYFTLKDARTSIKAVMFKWNASRLRFMPQNGMNVIIFGSVQLFERDGICQIICADMQPDGLGALYMAFEQLKERLGREGLFDQSHKKPLPPYPQKIAVVTAKTGAALQDIIQILSRRWPLGELILCPALVQGENAPDSIVSALRIAESVSPDVIIVGRGGGSLEDLWAFNDERVVRAVYACKIPVISAVGHETDVTICDLAADLRAPTPSAAAELCAPDIRLLRREVAEIAQSLDRCLSDRIRLEEAKVDGYRRRLSVSSPVIQLERRTEKLENLSKRMQTAILTLTAAASSRYMAAAYRLKAHSPDGKIREGENRLGAAAANLQTAIAHRLERAERQLGVSAARLEDLSPMRVLARGYTLTEDGGGLPVSLGALHPGDRLVTRFADGTAESIVSSVSLEASDVRKETGYGFKEESDI